MEDNRLASKSLEKDGNIPDSELNDLQVGNSDTWDLLSDCDAL